MNVVGILLAAGAGARFGGGKLIAPLPGPSHGVAAGTPIGVASCLHLVAALPRVIAVVRPSDVALTRSLEETGAVVVPCAQAHEGMGVSLAAGVAAAADAQGWVVALADMPWVAPATVAAVAACVRDASAVVAPRHAGRRGHPVGFGRAHFPALTALRGDEGARALVAAHAGTLILLDVNDPGVLQDVDRRDDLASRPA